jgi:ABC-type Na+ efflux pump permease subunit
MAWQVPHVLGGPVLHWELVRAARRPGPRLLHYGYLAWLFIQFAALNSELSSAPQAHRPPPPGYTESRATLETLRARLAARTAFADRHVALVLQHQLLLVLLLTPAFTAGALGREKERNTLTALLGTQLTAREIVTGKLLGRLAVLGRTILAALPPLVIMAVMGDLALGRLLLALGLVAVLAFALAAACMLASVWTRRTSDAILASYAALVVTYLAGQLVLGDRPLPDWLDPVDQLWQLVTPRIEIRPLTLLVHLAAVAGVGLLCTALAVKRLRPATLEQQERRPGRWLWALRPHVGDNPVRWRERYVLGLAPLPVLRQMPGWAGLLGVLSFSGILAVTALDPITHWSFSAAFRTGDFAQVLQAFRSMVDEADAGWVLPEVTLMGAVLVVIGAAVVGVRCGGSIAEEKRRKTWDDLVLTPLTLEEIVRDKRRGVLGAAVPHLAAYALPMVAVGALAGATGVYAAAAWVVAAVLLMTGASVVGAHFSARAEELGVAAGPTADSTPVPLLQQLYFRGEVAVNDGERRQGPRPRSVRFGFLVAVAIVAGLLAACLIGPHLVEGFLEALGGR